MTRIVELREGVLKKNDQLARELRSRYESAGVAVVNLVSSPGSGKTALLAETLKRLRGAGVSVAAITGDVATDHDQKRLAATGAPVRQIETHGTCHLDAEMIAKEIDGLDLGSLDLLFIENVGNLVCPASYDLGEVARIALLSVTEGEDKPLKYPTIFNSADVAVITKVDLAEVCEFDRLAAHESLDQVRPGIPVFETSAKAGTGLPEWLEYLTGLTRLPAAVPARGGFDVSRRSG